MLDLVFTDGWEMSAKEMEASWDEISAILASKEAKVFATYQKEGMINHWYVSTKGEYDLLVKMSQKQLVSDLRFFSMKYEDYLLLLKRFLEQEGDSLRTFV